MSGVSQAALDSAKSMGARAGERFRETGIPTPNPFRDVTNHPELAAAWRDGYFPQLNPKNNGGPAT